MKDAYKQKANDLVEQVRGRIKLVNYMLVGTKRPNPAEAKQYIKDALNGLEKIEELIGIS